MRAQSASVDTIRGHSTKPKGAKRPSRPAGMSAANVGASLIYGRKGFIGVTVYETLTFLKVLSVQ